MAAPDAPTFGAAIDALKKAASAKAGVHDYMTALNVLRALAPAGIFLRPSTTGSKIDVQDMAGVSVAMFYLNEYRSRDRCSVLTAYAWAGIQAIGAVIAALETNKESSR